MLQNVETITRDRSRRPDAKAGAMARRNARRGKSARLFLEFATPRAFH